MGLSWKNNIESTEDLKFKLTEDLCLISQNDNNGASGFVNHPNTNED